MDLPTRWLKSVTGLDEGGDSRSQEKKKKNTAHIFRCKKYVALFFSQWTVGKIEVYLSVSSPPSPPSEMSGRC